MCQSILLTTQPWTIERIAIILPEKDPPSRRSGSTLTHLQSRYRLRWRSIRSNRIDLGVGARDRRTAEAGAIQHRMRELSFMVARIVGGEATHGSVVKAYERERYRALSRGRYTCRRGEKITREWALTAKVMEEMRASSRCHKSQEDHTGSTLSSLGSIWRIGATLTRKTGNQQEPSGFLKVKNRDLFQDRGPESQRRRKERKKTDPGQRLQEDQKRELEKRNQKEQTQPGTWSKPRKLTEPEQRVEPPTIQPTSAPTLPTESSPLRREANNQADLPSQ